MELSSIVLVEGKLSFVCDFVYWQSEVQGFTKHTGTPRQRA